MAPNAPPLKTRAAAVSIVSNSCLIVLKVGAGLVTGSVGILSDGVHSLMDLIASLIAWASVRKADAPADASHRYGHEKLEDLAAGAQALLLLAGAVFIAVEATRRLVNGGHVGTIGVGIAVAAAAAAVNLVVSAHLERTVRDAGSSALHANAADLRTDAIVSLAVLVSLVVVKLTGAVWMDPVVGLLVVAAIMRTGARILIEASRRLADEALPADAHQLQDAIVARLLGTTALVHLEPQDRVRPDRFEEPDSVSSAR